ncbi:MAG: hypothetical protein JWQ09_3017 [Segetibacter sp.]|nr:hypothetical protein [Segetibacter sp.]
MDKEERISLLFKEIGLRHINFFNENASVSGEYPSTVEDFLIVKGYSPKHVSFINVLGIELPLNIKNEIISAYQEVYP